MRAIGKTDAVTTCDCCGKAGLKLTVAMETDAGDVVHYGSTCATRNSGKSTKQIKAEIDAESVARMRAARAAWRDHPARLAYQAKLQERDRINASRPFAQRLFGRPGADFVRAESQACAAALLEVAGRFGVRPHLVDA